MTALTTDITVLDVLTDAQIAEAWGLYQAAFGPLAILAAQRHLMTEQEFREVMLDPRIEKHVGIDRDHGDRMCALGAVTGELSAVPLISEPYYAHRWPQFHAQKRIFYVVFVGVHPLYRGSGIFAALVEKIWRVLLEGGGVVCVDFCTYNDQELALPRLVSRMTDSFGGGVRTIRLDEQAFWAYEADPPAQR
ncbi:hypothetical protein [Kineococcus glutinatus]